MLDTIAMGQKHECAKITYTMHQLVNSHMIWWVD